MINDRLRVMKDRQKPHKSQFFKLTERMDSWKDSLNKYVDALPQARHCDINLQSEWADIIG